MISTAPVGSKGASQTDSPGSLFLTVDQPQGGHELIGAEASVVTMANKIVSN
jgi:hypothetical protein